MASHVINGTAQDLISSYYAQGKQTFIIPLTFPDVTQAGSNLERIGYGGDVWELRVDLLRPDELTKVPSKDYVLSQLNWLRRGSDLPIIFTIRTVSQGGKFPDDAAPEALELMLLAAQYGCEYIDVEFPWPQSLKQEIVKHKGGSKLIASVHDWTGEIRWSDSLFEHYIKHNTYGDILKLSFQATSIEDCHELALLQRKYKTQSSKPIISVSMGAAGQLSRIVSPVSFVTHPLIPAPSAPGQISLAQVNQAKHLMGQLPKRNFYIFGNNISHSLSPTIHNTAFAELGLPHHYSIHQTLRIDDTVRDLIQSPQFGGASVTFPHKLNIQPLLDSESDASTRLGAVNTVIAEDNGTGRRTLRGENTDWIGIMRCIQGSGLTKFDVGIVVGAGGAARAAVYAYRQLGVQQIALVNRTRSTAERLVADFSPSKIDIYTSLAEAPPADVIVSCIPADDVTEADIPEHIFASGAGVVIEMSYRPPVSALMRVASRQPGWKVEDGVAVLKEQAYCQFEVWTGRRAPVLVIREALDKRNAAKM
ncbi:shikimate-5-dehydrogenase [Exophiala spinifera]|uniref:Shikimate-5-dehydrogenase n=1 Tax=Exophiala spinifera TaxID=91928 RepID=A0A0D1ZE89_9EURO|nr:shikimate-5-dehydrogenase [Exophiala spinifera]KIW11327.1 shikimate-5-dehydrogenase [Exophiala spinifera]